MPRESASSARATCQTALHGGAVAAVGGPNHDLDVARSTRQILRDRGGGVRAAVVDDDDAKQPRRPRRDDARASHPAGGAAL
jgi:hypothetical protein